MTVSQNESHKKIEQDENDAVNKVGKFVFDFGAQYVIPLTAVGATILGAFIPKIIDIAFEDKNDYGETASVVELSRPKIIVETDKVSNSDQETLFNYLIQIQSFLNSDEQKDINIHLLESHIFTALRSLDGVQKGNLIRFLAESQLIDVVNSHVSLSGADLRDIDLHDAWLPDINLEGTFLLKGDLSHTCLKRSILKGSNLSNVILAGADLREADLRDVNLSNAQLTDAQLIGAKYNRGTQFPPGFNPDQAGMKRARS